MRFEGKVLSESSIRFTFSRILSCVSSTSRIASSRASASFINSIISFQVSG